VMFRSWLRLLPYALVVRIAKAYGERLPSIVEDGEAILLFENARGAEVLLIVKKSYER